MSDYKKLYEALIKSAKYVRQTQVRYGKNRSFCRQDYVMKKQAESELDALIKKGENLLNSTQTEFF